MREYKKEFRIIILAFLLTVVQSCDMCEKNSSNTFTARIYADCNPTLANFDDNFISPFANVYADLLLNQIQAGGSSKGDADELGVNIFFSNESNLKPGNYDVSAVSPLGFEVYWDPGNDQADVYSSVSGNIRIVYISVDIGKRVVLGLDLTFNNVVLKNSLGNVLTICSGNFSYRP